MGGLKCKPGDLAIIIRPNSRNTGAMVECLSVWIARKGPAWKVKLISPMWNFRTGQLDPAGTISERGPYDADLQPIRGKGKTDAPDPVKEPLPCHA